MDIPTIVREKAQDLEEPLQNYVEKVMKMLKGMKPGDQLVVSKITKANTRELFLECCKWYMRMHNEDYQDGLSFGRGFETLTKYDLEFIKGREQGAESRGQRKVVSGE